ncbi:TPA: hypothetical protein JG847_004912 [Vibrio parahaemolyticus]|nr:hypothetical protein [Vibrio parahaemolyticus]
MKFTKAEMGDFAMCNIELISHFIGKCEDLHDIDPQDLSYSLSGSMEMLKASKASDDDAVTTIKGVQ